VDLKKAGIDAAGDMKTLMEGAEDRKNQKKGKNKKSSFCSIL